MPTHPHVIYLLYFPGHWTASWLAPSVQWDRYRKPAECYRCWTLRKPFWFSRDVD